MSKNNRPPKKQAAHAPYNFVPLPNPQDVIPAELEDDTLPRHDRYYGNRCSGHFDVTLTAETPLYIRGMLTAAQTLANSRESDKEKHAIQPDFFEIAKSPRIPGSSLRGMLRSLVEVATFSKIQPVSDRHKFFFRAVAAPASDPLRDPYRDVIGAFSKHVRAGYIFQRGSNWYIQPAQQHGREAFGKVKDINRVVGGMKDLIHLNEQKYHLQVHAVDYQASGRGRIDRVETPQAGQMAMAMLVCTGNMLETNKGGNTPRRNFALVLPPDRRLDPLRVPDQVVQDYKDALTPFVKEQFQKHFYSDNGVLVERDALNKLVHKNGLFTDGFPVFYVMQGGEVAGIGHTPNFRVPHLTQNEKPKDGRWRSVTPHDRIPDANGRNSNVAFDYAEAMFGFVPERGDDREAYAGRVSVTSGELKLKPGQEPQDVYAVPKDDPIPPKILASPKPTTFQHYLEQPQGSRTRKPDLHHYGTDGAAIRGHKMYWRQGGVTLDQIREDREGELESKKSQYTRIRPLKAGTAFTFRVYFDNLTKAELGALAWVLTLGGDPDARHMLGMGKPHGMGVIRLEPTLTLIDRTERYQSLFNEGGWAEGYDRNAPVDEFIKAFKLTVQQKTGQPFDAHDRIKELKTLLKLVNPSINTQYMTIEPNEFKDRPVLPYPSEVEHEG